MTVPPTSRPATPRALPELLDDLIQAAEARFGSAHRRVFFAPGRVNLMGAHLDYNGGPVMPTAIDRGTLLVVSEREDDRVRMHSAVDPAECDLSLRDLPVTPRGAWYDYPLGVLRSALPDASAPRGLDVLFGGNLPIGAGLSSSASICVVTALALDALWGLADGPPGWVERALEAERGFVGVQCGIMDPFAVGYSRPGHLLWLDCADRSVEHVPLDPARVAIAVADSGVRRELAAGAFNERVAQCGRLLEILAPSCGDVRPKHLADVPPEVFRARRNAIDPVLVRRGEHVFGELERTYAAKRSLLDGDPAGFGRAMTRSHASLREHFEVSTPELDALVELAVSVPGVLGSRLTGAGFGGCTVVLLERGAESQLVDALERGYGERFGRPPAVQVFGGDPGPRELAPE